MALDRDVERIEYGTNHPLTTIKAAADEVFYCGSIVMVDTDGYAYVGATDANSKVIGVAAYALDMTGLSSGEDSVIVKSGIFGDFENSASSDAIAEDDRFKSCYLVDDDTVALTDGGSTRSLAGTIHDVTADGRVVVQFEIVRN